MANRRMISKDVIDTDDFLDMSLSTQALYLHLLLKADDDGFVQNPKRIMRMIGANDDEMKVLVSKKYIIPFDTGVCVIKHWRVHNYIQSDRYKETACKEEKEQLEKNKNGEYSLKPEMDTQCIQNVSTGKDRLGKGSIGEDSKGKEKIAKQSFAGKDINELLKEFEQVNPTLNYGNKTQRKALEEILNKFGYEKTLRTIQYALSIQGKKYSPTITTPYQLKNKLGDLKVYYEKNNTSNVIDLNL